MKLLNVFRRQFNPSDFRIRVRRNDVAKKFEVELLPPFGFGVYGGKLDAMKTERDFLRDALDEFGREVQNNYNSTIWYQYGVVGQKGSPRSRLP